MIPVTVKRIDALLKDGNYTRAASLAVKLSNDPLVSILARELATVGNKNREGRGRRKYDPAPTPPNAANVLSASMLYADLLHAGRIVHQKIEAGDVEAKAAAALVRKHKLHGVGKWQQFPAQARSAVARDCGVIEDEIWR